MFTLFDLLSLFYVFVGIRVIATLVRQWRAFTDDELTASDRRLAGEAAFFIFIPIGVLLHELGHAFATYQVGGTIDWLGGGFHYALFWGYVIPQGRFTLLQDWWIALAGNLVSVVYGLLPLVFLPLTRRAWAKYTMVSLARIQLGWSLVGYPLLTLTGIDSDWSTIYSTRTLPVSAPLFVFHAALVIALFLVDRSARVKRWEVSLYAGAGDQLRALDAAVARSSSRGASPGALPEALNALVTRGNFFAASGQAELALADYGKALKLDPQNPRALYNIGQIKLMKKDFSGADKYLRRALENVGRDPQTADPETARNLAARIHFALAMGLYHRGKARDALPEFDQAIARLPTTAEFYYWRGIARRQTHDDLAARIDFDRAAQLAQESNPELAQQAREMAGQTG